MRLNIVKLKKVTEKYKKLGLDTACLGIIIDEQEFEYSTLFFNSCNQGDYMVLSVNKYEIEITNDLIPEDLYLEICEYAKKNVNAVMHKTSFNIMPFSECDQVVLIVEKEKYANLGLKKGDMGVVATNKATQNQILVDFGNVTETFDGIVSVDFNDLKKLENL